MDNDFLTELFSLMARDQVIARMTTVKPIASPAAGAQFSILVPGGVMWELVAVTAKLITDANVAARVPILRGQDADGNVLAEITTITAPAAASTFQFSWLETVRAGYTPQGNRVSLPIPLRFLYSGWTITSNTLNVQVGDQWSNIFVTFREWDVTSIMQEVEELDEQFQAYISRRA